MGIVRIVLLALVHVIWLVHVLCLFFGWGTSAYGEPLATAVGACFFSLIVVGIWFYVLMRRAW